MDKLIDYAPAENCSNIYSFGEICVRCGKCGRKFTPQEDGNNKAEAEEKLKELEGNK